MSLAHKLHHAATVFDRRREGKPGYNPYALPRYLGAVSDILAAVADGVPVRDAIVRRTNDRLRDALLRAIGEPRTTPAELNRTNAASVRAFLETGQ